MRFILILLVLIISLYANEITYNQLLESATKDSNLLKIRKSDELIEAARLKSLYSIYYPTLSLSYNSEYKKDLADGLSGIESVGNTVISNGTNWQNSLSLNMNYELYQFGVKAKQIVLAKQDVKIKKLLWCEEQTDLFNNILERFSSARKASIQQVMQAELLKLRKELYSVKQRLYRAGQYSKIDLGDEAIDIIDMERDIENSLMQYQDDLLELSKLSHIELDSNTDILLPIVQNNRLYNPSFSDSARGLKQQHKINQKKEEISLHNRTLMPKLSAYSNYYLFGSDVNSWQEATRALDKKSWSVGFMLRWNLFEGFKHNSEAERLEYELRRLNEEKDLQNREFDTSVKMAHLRITHFNEVEIKEKALLNETNEKLFMMQRLRKGRRVGIISTIQVEIEQLQRRLNLKLEQIDSAKAYAKLEILQIGVNECNQH